MTLPRVISILWGPFGFRADELAELIGARRASITLLYGPRYFSPIRYAALFLRTLLLLLRERPDVVYAQNPPVFCPFTALLFCRAYGSRLVIDHHSVWRVKTVGGPLSKAVGLLEAFVARAASANTAPHEVWARYLRGMGARRVEVVHDFVEENRFSRDERLRSELLEEPLVCISSHGGHPLERIEVEASAVARVGSVGLLVSGPREKLERRMALLRSPGKIRYVGFLERETYERLKASADFAINITDEPHTLSHVLYEYAAASLPVITNRQGVVVEVFGDALLYTETSDPREVAEKVRIFTDGDVRAEYRRRIRLRREALELSHEEEVGRLRSLFC